MLDELKEVSGFKIPKEELKGLDYYKVRQSKRYGNTVILPMGDLLVEGHHYFIKKKQNKIIIQDVQELVEDIEEERTERRNK